MKQRSFYPQKLLHTTSFYTEKLLHTASFHTQQVFTHRTLIYTQCFYTWQAFTHTETFTQRSFYTQRNFYTQRSFYTQQAFTHKISYTQQAFTEKSVYTEREAFVYITTTGIASPKSGSRHQIERKTILKHFWKGRLKGKLLAPKLRKYADKSLSQPWCSQSNTIYEIPLQKTIVRITSQTCTDLRTWQHQMTTITMAAWLSSSGVAMCVERCGLATWCCKTHCNGRMNVAWALFWGGSWSTKACIFPCKVVAAGDERYLVCAAVAAAVVSVANGFIPLRSTTADSKKGKELHTHTHTRGTFHRWLQPLYTEKCKLSCSGFLPKTKPIEHSCSHYNAFCSITWLTRISRRTRQHQMTTIMQPFHCDLQLRRIQETNRTTHTHRNNHSLQNTEEEPIRDRNDRSRNRRTHEVPFIAGCNHFTRKNTRFRAPASSPQQIPLSIHADITMRFFVATSLRHRFPSSLLSLVTTSLPHYFPSSPLPFVTTCQSHHFPSSPPPSVTTSQSHHFSSSPLPKVTTSQSHHHFPSSPISSSPLPCIAFGFFCDVLLRRTTLHCLLFFCDVLLHRTTLHCRILLWCIVTTSPPFINVKSHNSICL